MQTLSSIISKERYLYIWGTSLDAARYYYANIKRLQNIEGFIDGIATLSDTFMGKTIFNFNDVELRKLLNRGIYIIIATSKNAYESIANRLKQIGYKEFENFVWHNYLDRKLVILHGNCHMSVIEQYLSHSTCFMEKYVLLDIPRICVADGKLDENKVKHCDVYIHEDIRTDNAFGEKLSDRYIRSILPDEVVDVTVPNLFGLGRWLFPQNIKKYANRGENRPLGHDKNGMFPHEDYIIERAYNSGMNPKDIVKAYSKEWITKEEIQEIFDEYMRKIGERERGWDIKIKDFIIDHYKNRKLFYDAGHPCNDIMYEITVRILDRLGLDGRKEIAYEDVSETEGMDTHENPVYPCVIRGLELEWKDYYIRKSKGAKKLSPQMDYAEYVNEYIFWRYECNSHVKSEKI